MITAAEEEDAIRIRQRASAERMRDARLRPTPSEPAGPCWKGMQSRSPAALAGRPGTIARARTGSRSPIAQYLVRGAPTGTTHTCGADDWRSGSGSLSFRRRSHGEGTAG